jgi:hypothetical protein
MNFLQITGLSEKGATWHDGGEDINMQILTVS